MYLLQVLQPSTTDWHVLCSYNCFSDAMTELDYQNTKVNKRNWLTPIETANQYRIVKKSS